MFAKTEAGFDPKTVDGSKRQIQSTKFAFFHSTSFVELGGGVGDVPFWCRDGAYIEFDFR